MSVTFFAAKATENGTDLACRGHFGYCSTPGDCATYDADYDLCDCSFEAEAACVLCSMQVNMSNTNAAMLMARLGLDGDDVYCGSMEPQDLLGRVMVGNVGQDDSGTASIDRTGASGARFIDCGLPAGYFDTRFSSLADLALRAEAHGLVVAWG